MVTSPEGYSDALPSPKSAGSAVTAASVAVVTLQRSDTASGSSPPDTSTRKATDAPSSAAPSGDTCTTCMRAGSSSAMVSVAAACVTTAAADCGAPAAKPRTAVNDSTGSAKPSSVMATVAVALRALSPNGPMTTFDNAV